MLVDQPLVFGQVMPEDDQTLDSHVRARGPQHLDAPVDKIPRLLEKLFAQSVSRVIGLDGRDLRYDLDVPREGRVVLHVRQPNGPRLSREPQSVVDQQIVAGQMVGDGHDRVGVLVGMLGGSLRLRVREQHDRHIGMLSQQIDVRAQAVGPLPGVAVQVAVGANQVGRRGFDPFQQLAGAAKIGSPQVPPYDLCLAADDSQESASLLAERSCSILVKIGDDQYRLDFNPLVPEDLARRRAKHARKLIHIRHGSLVSRSSAARRSARALPTWAGFYWRFAHHSKPARKPRVSLQAMPEPRP